MHRVLPSGKEALFSGDIKTAMDVDEGEEATEGGLRVQVRKWALRWLSVLEPTALNASALYILLPSLRTGANCEVLRLIWAQTVTLTPRATRCRWLSVFVPKSLALAVG